MNLMEHGHSGFRFADGEVLKREFALIKPPL
jgi:hypothetical protein